ncbi:hypothetical protein HY312_02270 [Candidatus Saccharibacteria bacterium]|nr:hypothetical protein [Candidatus Saccharibacteria bacterium]
MNTEKSNTLLISKKYRTITKIVLVTGILLFPFVILFVISQIPDPNEPGGWAIFLGWIFYGPPAVLSIVLIALGLTRVAHIKHSRKVETIEDNGDQSIEQ